MTAITAHSKWKIKEICIYHDYVTNKNAVSIKAIFPDNTEHNFIIYENDTLELNHNITFDRNSDGNILCMENNHKIA